VLSSGANLGAVKLALEGADSARLDHGGNVTISSHGRQVRLMRPVTYQNVGGARHRVDGGYVLSRAKHGGYRLGFKVAGYDRGRSLVIDPIINYLTYLGGTGEHTPDGYLSNSVTAVTTDSSGNIYVIGATHSIDLPVTANAYNQFRPYSASLYVSEIDPTAPAQSELVYSSYFPADGTDTADNEATSSIAVDSSGRIHFTTNASTDGFPVTEGAYLRACPSEGATPRCQSPA
jgi:hypothetical protein